MEIEFSINDINNVASLILANNPHKVIVFNGEMGVGKTTLIKQLCLNLDVDQATSSPTFSLVNEYIYDENQKIYHFDLYRLKSENEALDFGIDEYLYSNNWCFIEWAEKIPNLLPEPHSVINIELLGNGNRLLRVV